MTNSPTRPAPESAVWDLLLDPDNPMPPYAALDWLREQSETDDVVRIIVGLRRALADRWKRWYLEQPEEVQVIWNVTAPALFRHMGYGTRGLRDAREHLESIERDTNSVTHPNRFDRSSRWFHRYMAWEVWLVTARRAFDTLSAITKLAGVLAEETE